jgi:STE24 endopeptidase
MEQIFTAEELARIDAYHFPRYVWSALSPVLYLLVLGLMSWRVAAPLYRLAQAASTRLAQRLAFMRRLPVLRAGPALLEKLWGGPGWAAALLFAVMQIGLLVVLWFPADVYFGYVREHRFGLSNYTAESFATDYAKSLALTLVATSFLALGVFGLARRLRYWWLVLGVIAGGLLLVSTAIDPYRSRLLFTQHSLEPGTLRSRIEGLMQEAKIEVGDILVEKTSRASIRVQAYFAGQGRTRSIVLNDTILEAMTEDELLAAIAHEAGHVHQPNWYKHLGSAFALLGFLYVVHRIFRRAQQSSWFGDADYADIRTLPGLMLAFYLLTTLARPVSGYFSREREHEADRFAVTLLGQSESFRGMLIKAAKLNLMDPDPPRWTIWRGASHPSIRERLEATHAR